MTYRSSLGTQLQKITDNVSSVLSLIPTAEEDLEPQAKQNIDSVNSAVKMSLQYNKAATQTSLTIIDKAIEAKAIVRPLSIKLMAVAQDTFTPATDIAGLKLAMQTLLTELKTKKSECESDIERLKGLIEEQKSALQLLETQMKQIRPSIDLAHPDSAWYFTVNIS